MWDPLLKNNFVNFINKRIFIKLDTRFSPHNLRHGILERISNKNENGDHTIILGYKSECRHSIVSDIIECVWYDNSLTNYINNKLLHDYLEKKLNEDIYFEIKQFIKEDKIYI